MAKKYCFVLNEETKEVRLGAGVDDEYYASIGMKLREVEQAYNGNWYLKGYAPVKLPAPCGNWYWQKAPARAIT